MTILERFEVKFGFGSGQNLEDCVRCDSRSKIISRFARSLVLGRSSDLTGLSQEERMSVENWYKDCQILIGKAEELARHGIDRSGLEFDGLKQRAKNLASVYFGGSEKGLVVNRVVQAYDAIVQNGGAGKRDDAVAADGDSEIGKIWVEYPRVRPDVFKALSAIQKFASWGQAYEEELKNRLSDFLDKYPDDKALCDVAVANGKLISKISDDAYQLGFRPRENKIRKMLDEKIAAANLPDYFARKIIESYEAGLRANTRRKEAKRIVGKERQKNEQANESVLQNEEKPVPALFSDRQEKIGLEMVASHPNSILGLRPAKKWTIVADETGTAFDLGNKGDGEKIGRYAFVLIPDYADLPHLPRGWHAVDKNATECRSTAEKLYNSGCGIIGISVDDLYRTNRRLWHSCIEMLLDITLRLIPVDGQTEIELNVEQCGANDSSSSGLLDKTMDDVMYHLSLVNPKKAEQIKLRAKFIAKTDCPFNGYADLVAYSWGCGKDMRKLFERFGWVGPCLIAEDSSTAKTFHRCLDLVRQDGALTAADWNVLVTCNEHDAVGSLIGALLRAYGEEARSDLTKWRIYLDYVVQHLDSKAIQMRILTPQIRWLKEYEPAEASLSPRIRLLWLTAQLASENHVGGVSFGTSKYAAEFAEHCERLREEDAPLVCFAVLNLAVEKTDRYEFAQARDLLLPWKDVDPAIPGSRYYAQVLSSLGQHEAFLGNNEAALILEVIAKRLLLVVAARSAATTAGSSLHRRYAVSQMTR